MRQTLIDLLKLGITETELEDDTKVKNLRVEPGKYP